jgi:hypothetical protein
MSLRREPRPHPYLFFSEEDLPGLKNRAGRRPHDACYRLLLQTADRLLPEPIPTEPAPENPHLRYRYHAAGRALQSCGQVLAFAFVLSGDQRYAARARDWGLAFAGWTRWASPADELPAAHTLLGTALLYDWLGDFLQPGERQKLRKAMVSQVRALHRRWQFGANAPSPMPPGSPYAWISLSAAGLGSLALLHEEKEAPTWAAECAELFQHRILPASFGRQGEFLAAEVGWDFHALRYGLLYCAGLERCSGPNLHLDSGLQAYPKFLLQNGIGDPLPNAVAGRFSPSSPPLRYLFLRLAHISRTGELYSLALRDGLELPEDTPLEWFYPYLHRTPYEPERWYTVALSWDAARAEGTLAIDRQRWNFPIDDPAFLARVDGVGFCAQASDFTVGTGSQVDGAGFRAAGAGFRLRHLGVRVGDDPAVVLLEQEAELQIGERQGRESTAARLQAPELHLEFPSGAAGMVWFQICKADLVDEAEIRLTCGSQPGVGLRLTAAGRTPVQGADFQTIDGRGRSTPPGSWDGDQIWFDSPWEYLWCPSEPPPERSIPRQSHHFLDAGMALLRGDREADPELRFHGANGDFALQVDGHLLTGLRAGSDATSEQLAPDGLPAPIPVGNAPRVVLPSEADDGDCRESPAPLLFRDGRIESFFTSSAFDAVVGNAVSGQVAPNLGGFRRSIAYIKPDYFVLADDFNGAAECRIEWRIQALGQLSLEAGRGLIRAGDRQLELFLLQPEGCSLERENADCLCAQLTADEGKLLALLVPGRVGSSPPFRPEAVDARGGYGLRLGRGGSVDFVLFRHPGQANLAVEGMRTDAELLFARRGGRSGLSLYGLVGGTRLQVRTELVRASCRVDLCVRQTPTRLGASLRADGDLELRLVIPGPPRAVRLDGVELAADAYGYVAQGRRLVLELTAGLHQLEVTAK